MIPDQQVKRPEEPHAIQFILTILLIIPVLSFSFLLIRDDAGPLGPVGTLNQQGLFLLLAYVSLLILSIFIFFHYHTVGRFFIAASTGLLMLRLVLLRTDNYTFQILLVSFCLFLILYTFYHDESGQTVKRKYITGILYHVLLLLILQFLIYRLDVTHHTSIRVILSVYAGIVLGFMMFFERIILGNLGKGAGGILTVILGISLLVSIPNPVWGNLLLFIFTLSALLRILWHLNFRSTVINLLFDNPFKLTLLSFASIILLGTLLLSLPVCSSTGDAIPVIDALFTSASATCVTGLTVLDTGRDFSLAGQVVIAVLIQMGGLGIITLMTFVGILMGQRMGLSQEYAVSEMIGARRPRIVREIVIFIVILTLVAEAMGALLMMPGFYRYSGDGWSSVWKGVFHAISAFCNAGFALQSDSFESFQAAPLLIIPLMVLIILGGVGFNVLAYGRNFLIKKERTPRPPAAVVLTLSITIFLLFSGFLLFAVSESSGAMKGMNADETCIHSMFLSTTARTAGFSALPMNSLSDATVTVLIGLMFVGGGPGSTAGGIKVTTLGVLGAIVRSHLKGRSRVALFSRELPGRIVTQAMVLVLVAVVLISTGTLVLELTQKLTFRQSLFEAVSAFGTVGLSLGATRHLDSFGKFIVILLMYTGRVGPLTFISLLSTPGIRRIRYPEEVVMIG